MYNLKELEKVKNEAIENKIPILMDDSLKEIISIIKEEQPKEILEIGTAVGYSASEFAIACPNTHIDTIELDEERYNKAKENCRKVGTDKQITFYFGDAVKVLESFDKKYDLIYIDANKGKYPIYLQHAIRLSNINAIILADNILYKGYVLSGYNKHKQRTAVRHLREYIAETMLNERLETEILNIGDGLSISRVIK